MVDLPKDLKKNIDDYCKLNEIEDAADFTIKCTKDGLTLDKYGVAPFLPKSQIQEVPVEKEIVKEVIKEIPVEKEAKLFKDQNYLVNQDTKRRTNSWRLDFAKNNISIEVGFNHGEAIAHNMMKTVFASEMNHIEKDIQTELGVVITATNNLKKAGNFDGAIGSFDKHISYFKAYYNYMPTPIVLIGLNEPESFYIDKKTREVVNL